VAERPSTTSTSTQTKSQSESADPPIKSGSVFTKDEEIRLRCIEAAARACSGNQYPQMGYSITKVAKDLERYMRTGE
jgi:hypothetical protein